MNTEQTTTVTDIPDNRDLIRDISNHLLLINDSLKWAKDYGKDSFPAEVLKEYRRKLKKIRNSLQGNCSAAAYGESQVGKSYLMSSLLSTPDRPFTINNNGREYSFIDELNPSGGNNAKVESTGVVTRFTIDNSNSEMSRYVKVSNLSVVDVILMLADAYYNDIKINPDSVLRYDQINAGLDEISEVWADKSQTYGILEEDDIKDIGDYLREIVGTAAAGVHQSNFVKVVGPVIKYVDPSNWHRIFSYLWNCNPEIDRLFVTLMDAFAKLNYSTEVYVPFDAVLRDKGTLLKIDWLDGVCGVKLDTGSEITTTDVYDRDGKLLAKDFPKSELSALIAELTFVLPKEVAEQRHFLSSMDLLDFPGARAREKFEEAKMADVVPKMLRRGKVAYLFNKYSRSLQIGSVLFCHHHEQKNGPTVGETINSWIESNIGTTPAERTRTLMDTKGISPLFLVATKFNIDLERTKNDNPDSPGSLDKHWSRFDTVIPEIIKPNTWMERFVESGPRYGSGAFTSIFPLRDFYWSSKGGLFDGYSDGEKPSPELAVHSHADYPAYLERLRESFMNNAFVKEHFPDPSKSWDSFATLNNDGSKAIIDSLGGISDVIDKARRSKYFRELTKLKKDVLDALTVYFEPENIEAKNKRVWKIAGDIRRSLTATIARSPEVFGKIIDSLMISPEEIRNIAYDIIVCHTDEPVDFAPGDFYRNLVGIDNNASREENIEKLLFYFMLETEEELSAHLSSEGLSLEDILSPTSRTLSTIGDVVTQHIMDFWSTTLNARAKELQAVLPHADEVVFMLLNLFNKLGIRDIIARKINRYNELFSEMEQPNAVGDFVSLTLNNFVSSVGRNYIPDSELPELKAKAQACKLAIDFSPKSLEPERQPQPLLETLQIFDEVPEIINMGAINPRTLAKLPFWNNFQRWENLLNIGLLYSSDISRCDPACNKKVQELIARGEELYT